MLVREIFNWYSIENVIEKIPLGFQRSLNVGANVRLPNRDKIEIRLIKC